MASTQEIHAKRPTSPHLTIYRPQISSSLSILHRLTGVCLFFALIVISWWMVVVQFYGFSDHLAINRYYVGRLALYAVSYAAVYHLLNGIRHLFWDIGCGFSVKTINFTGWLVVVLSILITILLWSNVL